MHGRGQARTLLVLGLARSGVAAAGLAVREGWTVLASDDRDIPVEGLPHAVRRVRSAEAKAALAGVDAVVPSPGVPASHPVLVEARRLGVAILPEIELATDHLAGTLLAVTGTNGKSTTVSLLGAMLAETGARVFTGGNLGVPLSAAVGVEHDFVVAEVSSFQLEHATRFHPRIASMLTFTPDHLDRHGDLEGYLAAKLRLFACMTADDHAVLPVGEDWAERAAASTRAAVTRFGWMPAGSVAAAAEGTFIDRASRRLVGPGGFEVALPRDGWPMLPHDLENAAAAVEMARLAGAPADAVARAIASFRPLRHRLAKVGERGGVGFWNDSKATNVGAALSSLRAFDGGVVLLAGGVSKGCDFSALAKEAGRIAMVVAFGEAAPEIEAAVGATLKVVREPGLRAALARGAAEASPGQVVLLAPACASFDEFRDYVDRGERFERWVAEMEVTR